MNENTRRSIYITPELTEQVNTYAAAKGVNFNQAVRLLLEKGLTVTAFADGENMIRGYIRDEIERSGGYYWERTLSFMENRLLPLIERATKTAAVTFATVIGMLTENYTDNRTHESILATAKRYAAKYLGEPPKSEETYRAEAKSELGNAYGLSRRKD